MPCRTPLKRPGLSLSRLTRPAGMLSRSSLMSMSLCPTPLSLTSLSLLPRGRWTLRCKLCMLILMRCLLEAQAKEMQNQLDEAETNALKGGKKAMNKMETRIRELESELDAEGRRFADGQKNLRKSERRIKELTFASDEDRKNHERMQGLIDSLQGKIKTYKKQIEEAEEIAALNLAKFRQTQANLADAEERADLNEQALAKCKARGRSASLAPL